MILRAAFLTVVAFAAPAFAQGALSEAETRAECEYSAELEGFRIVRIVSQSELADGGRVNGRIVAMDARANDQNYRMNCQYVFGSGRIALETLRR